MQPYALMQPSQTLGPRGAGNMSHTGILEQSAFRVTHSPVLNDVNRMLFAHTSVEKQSSQIPNHRLKLGKIAVSGNEQLTPAAVSGGH